MICDKYELCQRGATRRWFVDDAGPTSRKLVTARLQGGGNWSDWRPPLRFEHWEEISSNVGGVVKVLYILDYAFKTWNTFQELLFVNFKSNLCQSYVNLMPKGLYKMVYFLTSVWHLWTMFKNAILLNRGIPYCGTGQQSINYQWKLIAFFRFK